MNANEHQYNIWKDPRNINTYTKSMHYTWKQLNDEMPNYIKRISPVIDNSKGRVLEIGCGCGNITRWLSESVSVSEIIAVDGFQDPIDWLNSFKLNKVSTIISLVDDLDNKIEGLFDTVVICEIIEHIILEQEIKMINSIKPLLKNNGTIIVSTPIDALCADPYHIRMFSKSDFKKHISDFYGETKEYNYDSGYSQVAIIVRN